LVEEARNAGVKHFTWSTLLDMEEIGGGTFNVLHGKAKVDAVALMTRGRHRFQRPATGGGLFARQICARCASPTHNRRDMWTPAHASKTVRANQLPAWLSAKRTAAFGFSAPSAGGGAAQRRV
jgi:hypothetical protein